MAREPSPPIAHGPPVPNRLSAHGPSAPRLRLVSPLRVARCGGAAAPPGDRIRARRGDLNLGVREGSLSTHGPVRDERYGTRELENSNSRRDLCLGVREGSLSTHCPGGMSTSGSAGLSSQPAARKADSGRAWARAARQRGPVTEAVSAWAAAESAFQDWLWTSPTRAEGGKTVLRVSGPGPSFEGAPFPVSESQHSLSESRYPFPSLDVPVPIPDLQRALGGTDGART